MVQIFANKKYFNTQIENIK